MDFNLNPATMFSRSRAGTTTTGAPVTGGSQPGAPAPATVPNSGGMPNQPVNKGAGQGTDGQPNLDGGTGELNADGTPKNKAPASPLDAFSELFTIDPDKKLPKDPLKDPLFTTDPAKLAEAVSKMDFARGINPELVAKALGGDAQSFASILNTVARNSYMLSTQMVTQLMSKAFETNNSRWDGALSSRFRDFQINYSEPKNQALKHKAAQPVLAALKQTIASQNPELAPHEVATRAEDYFLSMAKAITSVGADAGGEGGTGTRKGGESQDMDWLKYLETPAAP